MISIINIYKNICIKIIRFAAKIKSMKMNLDDLLSNIEYQQPIEQHELKLIDGIFDAEDGKKILLEMFNSKINFHNKQILRMQEQRSLNTTQSEKRLNELLDTVENLKAVLLKAEQSNQHIKIHCPVIIEVI